MASAGYATDYTAVPARWLELDAEDSTGKSVRRVAWKFSGKNLDRAERAYDKALADFAAQNPGVAATFPTNIQHVLA